MIVSNQVLAVTYDLKASGMNYTNFYEALKRQGEWWHYLSSMWLIVTAKSPQDVYNELAPHLTIQDFILILPVKRPYWGFLPKDAWDWIESRLPFEGGYQGGPPNLFSGLLGPGKRS